MTSIKPAQSSDFVLHTYIKSVAANLYQADKAGLSLGLNIIQRDLLSASLPPGVKIHDEKIEFDSLAVRNQLAAEYHFDKNKNEIGTSSNERWLKICHDLWIHDDHSSSDTVAGRLLAILDRSFGVLSLAAATIKQGNVFDILLPVAASFPHLEKISVDQLYLLCIAQDDLTKRDYFRGQFFQKLSLALSHRIEVAREIITRQRRDIGEKTASLYMAASSAIATLSPMECALYVLEDTRSENPTLCSAAVQMIGNLIHDDRLDRVANEKMAEVIRGSLSSTDSHVRESALQAILYSAHRTNEFDLDVQALVSDGDSVAAYYLARILQQHWKTPSRRQLTETIVPILCTVFSLSDIDSTFLDSLLADMLVESQQHGVVLRGLQQWILAPQPKAKTVRNFIEDLDGTIAKIIRLPMLLSHLLSEWLIHDDVRLSMAAGEIVNHVSLIDESRELKLTFSPDEIASFDFSSFELLAFRTIAFVTMAESQVSLILSLLSTPNLTDLHLEVLRQILIGELGYEYAGLVILGLEEFISSSPVPTVRETCEQVTTQLKRNSELRKHLPYRKELQPPASLVQTFAKQRAKEMYTLFKQSESRSVFLNLVTKIPIKAGRQVFNFQQLPLDRAMNLKSFEITRTVPRSLIMDPLGLEYRRRVYMGLKKDSK